MFKPPTWTPPRIHNYYKPTLTPTWPWVDELAESYECLSEMGVRVQDTTLDLSAQERIDRDDRALSNEVQSNAEDSAASETQAIACVADPVSTQATRTREELRNVCEDLFGTSIKPKLTFLIDGVPDTQQWEAACELVYYLGELGQNRQIIAPTGQGKTFVCAATLRMLAEIYPDRFAFNGLRPPWIVIQPPKAIMQTQAVFSEYGVFAIVTSLASLRASLGDTMIEFRTVIINGQPQLYPYWINQPMGIWLDESQQVKNEESTQSQIIESAAYHNIPVVPASATPYSRIKQGKTIALVLRPEVNIGGVKHKLTPKMWPSFAADCCVPGAGVADWSPKSLKNFQAYLEPYTTRWSIPYPHAVKTRVVECSFLNAQSRQRYDKAMEEWDAIKLKNKQMPTPEGPIRELVALQKYCQVAEEERAEIMAQLAVERWKSVRDNKKRKQKVSIILGFAYKTAFDRCYKEFIRILGEAEAKRLCAFVCGGRNCDNDIWRFKADKAPFMLLTIACGGAALSLDHNSKNRNQREMYVSSVWNDIQMAQLAGRTQRLDTQSVSYMNIMVFRDTVEIDKYRKVRYKIKCLKEIATVTGVRNEMRDASTFVSDIGQLEHRELKELTMSQPETEEQEEQLASEIIGTQQRVRFEEAKEGEGE